MTEPHGSGGPPRPDLDWTALIVISCIAIAAAVLVGLAVSTALYP